MKKMLFVMLVLVTAYTAEAQQSLFTYGKKTVTRNEFIRNFNKNNTNTTPAGREAALKENLELYIRYKLKVQAAYDMRYDTLRNQREDLLNFRRQIENNYLNDQGIFDGLVEEAFQRQQKDIHLAHIIIPFDKNVKPLDTNGARMRIYEAWTRLKAGEDFAKVARQYSVDPDVAANNGSLGYITVFSLPYDMETVAYNTAPGKFSAPFISSIGYHIFKNMGERKALGKVKAAQILLNWMPGATEQEKAAVAKQAQELYDRLQKGEVFENLARTYSGDYLTAPYGGVLAEFGVGKYDIVFENAVYGLAQDNDYSKPFSTAYGWHIVKRLERMPVNSDKNNANAMQLLADLVRNDKRSEIAKEVFIKQVMQKTGYKEAPVNKGKLYALTRTVFEGRPVNDSEMNENTLLHTVGTQKVTVGNYWRFAADTRNTGAAGSDDPQKLLQDYAKATSMEYYRDHLEDYNPAFSNQLTEFKDGNLLFEAMEKNVWNKASQDSAGLERFYNSQKTKYTWDRSASAIIFSTSDLKTAEEINEKIKKNPADWKNIMMPYMATAQADSGRFELSTIPVRDKTAFTDNMSTMPFTPGNDGSAVFAYIFKIYEAGGQRSFEEARGLVINDYQQHLEEQWIAALKKKYPVKMNAAVWKDVLKKGK